MLRPVLALRSILFSYERPSLPAGPGKVRRPAFLPDSPSTRTRPSLAYELYPRPYSQRAGCPWQTLKHLGPLRTGARARTVDARERACEVCGCLRTAPRPCLFTDRPRLLWCPRLFPWRLCLPGQLGAQESFRGPREARVNAGPGARPPRPTPVRSSAAQCVTGVAGVGREAI